MIFLYNGSGYISVLIPRILTRIVFYNQIYDSIRGMKCKKIMGLFYAFYSLDLQLFIQQYTK